MFITCDLSGQNTPMIREFRIHGNGADIVHGALMEPGAATTHLGVAVPSANPPTMVLGTLTQLHDYSVTGDYTFTAVTSNLKAKGDVDVRPFGIFRSEVAVCATQAITIAASAGSAAGAVTFGTTLGTADEVEGAYLYNAATDEVRYVEDQDAATTGVLSDNIGTTAWAAVLATIVPPIFYGAAANTGLTLGTNLDTVICEGNGTGAWCRVIGSYIQVSGRGGLDTLRPETHCNSTLADARFFVDFVVIKHALNS